MVDLDFVTLEELIKRTGISPRDSLRFALNEMLCNALDKEDATEIIVDLKAIGDYYWLTISDNGSKKLREKKDVKLIFDFVLKASSKRGLLTVSRGYLGEALKDILGFTYTLAELKDLNPPPIIVRSAGKEYAVSVKVDKIRETAAPEVKSRDVKDDGFTTFIVRLPRDLGEDIEAVKEGIHATSMVNPSRSAELSLYLYIFETKTVSKMVSKIL